MALFVNTNVAALNGQKNLSNVTNRLNSSFEKLSSGSRINTAKDDAAGLQVSDRLTTQIIGLNQATRNANDGISIAQIAEGALQEVTNNVQRMRQLVVQGGNSTLAVGDREALGREFEKLLNVNEDIANRTGFGQQKLLDGSAPDGGFSIQSGAYTGERDTITTGNSTLKGLLQGVLDRTGGYDTAIASVLGSAATPATASSYGVVGELLLAYQAVTGVVSNAAVTDLFGANAMLTTITIDQLADNSNIAMAFTKLTDILDKMPQATGSTADQTMFDYLSTSPLFQAFYSANGISSVVGAGGFDNDQIGALRDFATDMLLDAMSDIVGQVGAVRAKLGAEQNGLASVIRSNTAAIVNVSDSRSRITDTDFAAETAELTRNQIIQQASNSILAQANQLPQAALSLLGN